MFEAEQQLLPTRFCMARAEVEAKVLTWSGMAGRALHDLLRAEAVKVGMPVPPRALRIPFTMLHPRSEEVVPDSANANQQFSCSGKSTSVADTYKLAWFQGTKMQ